MGELTEADLARLRASVRLRDDCVRAALEYARRLGIALAGHQARAAYDAMSPLIRAASEEDR